MCSVSSSVSSLASQTYKDLCSKCMTRTPPKIWRGDLKALARGKTGHLGSSGFPKCLAKELPCWKQPPHAWCRHRLPRRSGILLRKKNTQGNCAFCVRKLINSNTPENRESFISQSQKASTATRIASDKCLD